MVDPRLIAYIRDQRANNYSDEAIRSVLLQQGYPQSLVDSALSAASSPTVADSKILRTYIKSYLEQGYSQEQITQGLLQQGFLEKDVTRAFKQITPIKKPVLIVFPLLAIIILVGGYFFVTNFFDSPNTNVATFPSQQSTVRLQDIITNLLPMASKNPTAALELCKQVIIDERSRCFLAVSRSSNNPAVCEEISDPAVSDTCYLDPYIYDGNLEFCSQLQLSANIEYCSRVRSLLSTAA